MAINREGWVAMLNTRKWHYIVDTKSLCGGWMYLGSRFEQGNDDSPDNCKKCVHKLKVRQVTLVDEKV